MAVGWLQRLALGAPAPVFVAVGAGMQAAVEDLSLDPRLSLVASPRHAELLLVAGALRDADLPDLRRLHDQLPHPRATVFWRSDARFDSPGAPPRLEAGADPAAALLHARLSLFDRTRDTEPDLLPDVPPNPWKGKGPFGQGGEGMMGGTPYGRPMTMTGDERRDGLVLDLYTASFGPFLPPLPPGLVLELSLQGDMVQDATLLRPPYPQPPEAAAPLRRAARLLALLGLRGQAERLLRQAHDGSTAPERTARWVARTGAFLAVPPELGQASGRSVRDRLRCLCAGEADPVAGPLPASTLLPGLEWHEAMLLLAALPPEALRQPVSDTPRKAA